MKLKFWPVFGIVLLILLMFVTGYIIGYVHGMEKAVEYGSQIVDKIHIDNFNVDINQTKIDDTINEIKQIAIQRMGNSTNE
jgi:hypothetical protein